MVLACASAGRFLMPPFCYLLEKNLTESLDQGEFLNSNNGWIDRNYFKNSLLIKYASATRPLVLLLDRHACLSLQPCMFHQRSMHLSRE